MQGFLKQHPRLSIHQFKSYRYFIQLAAKKFNSTATSFSNHDVKFIENLKNALSWSDKFSDGSYIYNLDETLTTICIEPENSILWHQVLNKLASVQVVNKASLSQSLVIGFHIPSGMVFSRNNFKICVVNGKRTLELATNSG